MASGFAPAVMVLRVSCLPEADIVNLARVLINNGNANKAFNKTFPHFLIAAPVSKAVNVYDPLRGRIRKKKTS